MKKEAKLQAPKPLRKVRQGRHVTATTYRHVCWSEIKAAVGQLVRSVDCILAHMLDDTRIHAPIVSMGQSISCLNTEGACTSTGHETHIPRFRKLLICLSYSSSTTQFIDAQSEKCTPKGIPARNRRRSRRYVEFRCYQQMAK
jgi:hypothetical protein